MEKVKRHTKRVFISIVGTVVVLVGIVAIPYPGPGWLIVFAGLAILATEFMWARRLLDFARGYYDTWTDWLKRQPFWARLAIGILTGMIVIVTLWLVNTFGLINSWLHLPFDWIQSPLF
jgi:uncharacterized protein (TIGR02611 family)